MQFLKIYFLIFLFTLNLDAKTTIQVGIFYEKLFINEKNVDKIAARLWEKYINKENPDIKLSIKFYKDISTLLEDYKNKKLSAILSNDLFYLKNKNYIDLFTSKKWIISRSKDKFEELCLIKNRESIFNLKNLKAQEILYIDKYSKIWFESLIDLNTASLSMPEIKKVIKPKKLFFELFFKKDSVAIMSKSMYDTMIELNPQIKEKVEIIKKSQKIFFLGIGFIRKDISEKIYKIANRLISEINSTDDNFETGSYLQIQNIIEMKEGDLDKLELFYKKFMDINSKKK